MNLTHTKRTAALDEPHRSPSPRPSPAGRGRIVRRSKRSCEPEIAVRSFPNQWTYQCCSLSPGERVRVRAGVTAILKTSRFVQR
jgi:hypothetical protein